jgi:exodeoxyribonuclease-5
MAIALTETRWNSQQSESLSKISQWLEDPHGKQIFRLFGYAGTGKTQLAAAVYKEWSRAALAASFTGKAASVMRSRGLLGATTIHRLIYRRAWVHGEWRFILNGDSPVRDAKLVIIDEVSMVGDRLGRDLVSFGTPILVMGDPAQLPPVKDSGGFFMGQKPDVLLTEIHRQAKENPIISMSMEVRAGKRLVPGMRGSSRVVRRGSFSDDKIVTRILEGNAFLCGLNATRRKFNRLVREALGRPDDPVPGDRLICLHNNHAKGVMNGELVTVRSVRQGENEEWVDMTVTPDGDEERAVEISVHRSFLLEEKIPTAVQIKSFDQYTFAYALTVHKAQGSEWDSVLLMDEKSRLARFVSPDIEPNRWLYTGVTRASKQIVVINESHVTTETICRNVDAMLAGLPDL